jgi:hypothetical protein
MSKSFLYVNASGVYEESAGAYEEADFINSSAGVGDAGKPIVLDAAGKLSATFLDTSAIDHGGLGGLGDDDHTIYTKADGTRAFTGDQSMGSNKLTSLADAAGATDAVPLGQLNTTTNGKGASLIGVEDSGGNFTATDVEGVLSELAAAHASVGISYTCGAGGVTKGDLLYISGNDTVDTLTTSTDAYAVGIAASTATAGNPVIALANDEAITAVLTGTAGETMYWDGSSWGASVPAGSGAYVWQGGIATIGTDMAIEIAFLKRNKP